MKYFNSNSLQEVDETFSQTSVDEVDGSSRRRTGTAFIVDAFFKLAFLKILFIDIGISLGNKIFQIKIKNDKIQFL